MTVDVTYNQMAGFKEENAKDYALKVSKFAGSESYKLDRGDGKMDKANPKALTKWHTSGEAHRWDVTSPCALPTSCRSDTTILQPAAMRGHICSSEKWPWSGRPPYSTSPMQFSGRTGLATPSTMSKTFGPSFLHKLTRFLHPMQRTWWISGTFPFTNILPKASAVLPTSIFFPMVFLLPTRTSFDMLTAQHSFIRCGVSPSFDGLAHITFFEGKTSLEKIQHLARATSKH